jgi:hypothetical protein
MSLDMSTIKHHSTLEEIVDVLCNKTQNLDRSFFRTELVYFFSKMASCMRATIITKDRGEIPVNMYALALAPSGSNKGHSISIVENELLPKFKARFMEDTFPVISDQNLWVIANQRAARNGNDQQVEYDKANTEFKQAGVFPFTFDSGTTPAVKQLRQKLLLSSAGSINLQIDEIGSNLIGQTDILNTYLELYDLGMVKQKLVKNTSENLRTQELDGKTPANMLLFGTPAKLLDGSTTEDQFYSFLETGYARRCIFGYGQPVRASQSKTPAEIFKLLTEPSNEAILAKWAHKFYELADPAIFGWKMTVDDDVSIELLSYRIECEKAAEHMPEHEEIKKSELSHRYFKALKLAGAYAFIDGSTEILMEHLEAAIKLVEESGASFQTILNREKSYVKLAKYIAGVNTEVTHADLTEALPFYKTSKAQREEQMTLAAAWGYKKHIIIKKSFIDGIEFFKGEKLQETDFQKIVVSYSSHWAYNYIKEIAPFDKLHILMAAPDMHWANHHFKQDHRAEENVILGFNMIVIDVDSGVSLATAHELMKDYKFLTYTTKRHTPDHNRFRMILPTSYHLELDHDEYKAFMNCVMAWLPFPSDESANQRAKKWQSHENGQITYNLEAKALDVLDFIPKTSRNELHQQRNQELGSLDNLERWFASRMAVGNRNNQMIKYALVLVDAGWKLLDIRNQVHAFNAKLSDPMTAQELDSSIMVTVAKKVQTLNPSQKP